MFDLFDFVWGLEDIFFRINSLCFKINSGIWFSDLSILISTQFSTNSFICLVSAWILLPGFRVRSVISDIFILDYD